MTVWGVLFPQLGVGRWIIMDGIVSVGRISMSFWLGSLGRRSLHDNSRRSGLWTKAFQILRVYKTVRRDDVQNAVGEIRKLAQAAAESRVMLLFFGD